MGLTRFLMRSQGRFRSLPTRIVVSLGLAFFNAVGAATTFILAAFVVPLPIVQNTNEMRIANLILASFVGTAGVLIGVIWVNVAISPMASWIRQGANPHDEARLTVLRAPSVLSAGQAAFWGAAAVGFAFFNARYDPRMAIAVFLIIVLSGAATTTFTYLGSERAMRGFARRAMEGGVRLPPHRSMVRRTMANWALGTGVSLLGILLVGIAVFVDQRNTTRIQLAVTMVTLGSLGILVGGVASWWAAKTSADPIRAMRKAMARVERGDYDITVPIYDATEIGHLQAGFNRMAAGLRERERLRDLFGRHVGEDVARNALESGVKLGGEVRDVAVLFVDIVGSTTIAEVGDPEEVVALLNRYFDVVIDTVDRHGGWINKFEGDAALAIWGAPTPIDNRNATVLAAVRTMAGRLRREVPEVRAGIGVSAGRVVAGNVGAHERYEYTVIGDAVNEASRLTDIAKDFPELVAVSAALLDGVDEAERARWLTMAPLLLRGRSQPTSIVTLGS